MPISAASTNGASRKTRYVDRALASPMRTASVRLPDDASDDMSRRLLIINSAQESSPAGTDAASPSHDSRHICTYAVPATAATPKNRNTDASPRPRYPYVRGPPVAHQTA